MTSPVLAVQLLLCAVTLGLVGWARVLLSEIEVVETAEILLMASPRPGDATPY